jgi:hypothetical protein
MYETIAYMLFVSNVIYKKYKVERLNMDGVSFTILDLSVA